MYTNETGITTSYNPSTQEIIMFSMDKHEVYLVATVKRVPIIVFEVESVIFRLDEDVDLQLQVLDLVGGRQATVIGDNELTRHMEWERLRYEARLRPTNFEDVRER